MVIQQKFTAGELDARSKTHAAKFANNLLDKFKELSSDLAQADSFEGVQKDAASGQVRFDKANLAAAVGKDLNPKAAGLAMDKVTGFVHLQEKQATSLDVSDGEHRFVMRQERGSFGFGGVAKTQYTMLTREAEKDGEAQWAPAAQLTVNPDGSLDLHCSESGQQLLAQSVPMYIARK